MPTDKFISDLLEIKDIIVTKIENTPKNTHIYFSLNRKDHECPKCGSITNRIHDYRTSIIKDSPIQGRPLLLHYRKRRYHCPDCGCHFYEKFSLLPKHCRITNRLNHLSIHLLRNTQNVSSVAASLGISPSSVFRSMKTIRFPKPAVLPNVLSIDEFRGNAGGQKFQAILTDPKHHRIIDILPSRTQFCIEEYLKGFGNRKDVRFFVMDMNRVYLDAASRYLPNATVIIDKFHVIRYVNWALENVRKRIQKQMHISKRKYFKRSRKILLAHYNDLKEENKQALEIMLQQSNDLAVAYYLKEQFYGVFDSKDKATARDLLHKFVISAQASDLKEFDPCLTMLANWSKYILNAFDFKFTNGFTEGCNNKIKVIKRNAYGYRNFENFRNRIMLSAT